MQGTRARPYEVDLWLEVDAAGDIVEVDNVCMCPVKENCKHVVATLLSLGQGADLATLAAGYGAVPPQGGDFPEPGVAVLNWIAAVSYTHLTLPTSDLV